MKRRVLNLLTGLSLLLCAAIVALWWSGDIYYFGPRPRWSITAEQGTLSLRRGYGEAYEAKVHWILLVGLALPAARAIRKRWRGIATRAVEQSRRRAGLCPACGYDVRATPDRCPECGRAPVVANA